MTTIQNRRGTAAEWASVNPILAPGEWGQETDTGRWKAGNDAATPWNSLGYSAGPPGAVAIPDGAVTSAKIADGTITDTDVSPSAAIAESKLNLASDAPAGTPSRRTLGTGATQAAAGNDPRLSALRAPIWLPAEQWRKENGATATRVILGRTVIDLVDSNQFYVCDRVPHRFDHWTSYQVTLSLAAPTAATGNVQFQWRNPIRTAPGVNLGTMDGAPTTQQTVTIPGPAEVVTASSFGPFVDLPPGTGPVRLRFGRLGDNLADTLPGAVTLVGVTLTHP